jgi:hypothetical protein
VQPLKTLELALGGLIALDKHKDQLKQQAQDKLQNLFK